MVFGRRDGGSLSTLTTKVRTEDGIRKTVGTTHVLTGIDDVEESSPGSRDNLLKLEDNGVPQRRSVNNLQTLYLS